MTTNITAQINSAGLIPMANDLAIEEIHRLGNALKKVGISSILLQSDNEDTVGLTQRWRDAFPDLAIGIAGCQISKELQFAIDAGAQFALIHGDEALTAYCAENAIPYFSETDGIEADLTGEFYGFNGGKSSPEESKVIVRSALPLADQGPFLSDPDVLAVIMDADDLTRTVETHREEELFTYLTNQYQSLMGFQLAHMGINTPDEAEANQVTNTFHQLFGFPIREIPMSFFLDNAIEIMKYPYHGTHGHIAIKTYSIDRAMNWFRALGLEFIESTIKQENGITTVAYLKDEIGGFAVHLVVR